MGNYAADVQEILRQVEDELMPIIAQGLSASITIHCGQDKAVIEVNRRLTIKRTPKCPPAQGWENNR